MREFACDVIPDADFVPYQVRGAPKTYKFTRAEEASTMLKNSCLWEATGIGYVVNRRGSVVYPYFDFDDISRDQLNHALSAINDRLKYHRMYVWKAPPKNRDDKERSSYHVYVEGKPMLMSEISDQASEVPYADTAVYEACQCFRLPHCPKVCNGIIDDRRFELVAAYEMGREGKKDVPLTVDVYEEAIEACLYEEKCECAADNVMCGLGHTGVAATAVEGNWCPYAKRAHRHAKVVRMTNGNGEFVKCFHADCVAKYEEKKRQRAW